MNEIDFSAELDEKEVSGQINRWIIAKAKEMTKEVSRNLDNFRFADAANAAYQFVWGDFCDWYIEMSKPVLYGEDRKAKAETKAVFAWVLRRIMIVLHPFMPFITTQIWNDLGLGKGELMLHEWCQDEAVDVSAQKPIDWVIEAVSQIRSLRSEMNLPAGAKLKAYLQGAKESQHYLADMAKVICALARLEFLQISEEEATKDMVKVVTSDGVVLLSLQGVIDFAAERERLTKELAALEKNLQGYEAKLNNPVFVERAPEKIVAEERRRRQEALDKKQKIEDSLNKIKDL